MYQKANAELRQYMAINGVRQWEVAAHMGVHESVLSRWMRVPLSDGRKVRVESAVKELVRERRDALQSGLLGLD